MLGQRDRLCIVPLCFIVGIVRVGEVVAACQHESEADGACEQRRDADGQHGEQPRRPDEKSSSRLRSARGIAQGPTATAGPSSMSLIGLFVRLVHLALVLVDERLLRLDGRAPRTSLR
jgi:hypothetical protein